MLFCHRGTIALLAFGATNPHTNTGKKPTKHQHKSKPNSMNDNNNNDSKNIMVFLYTDFAIANLQITIDQNTSKIQRETNNGNLPKKKKEKIFIHYS